MDLVSISMIFIILIQFVISYNVNNKLKRNLTYIERSFREKTFLMKKLEDMVIIQSEANRIRTEILANIGFEFRTQLNAIIGFSEIMADPNHDPYDKQTIHKYMEYAKYIHDSGRQILNAINTLIEINQIDYTDIELDCEPVQLKDLVQVTMNFVYDKMVRKQITEHIEIDSNMVVNCDSKILKKILINIMQNAIKYNINKGHIYITSEIIKDSVVIKVKDTGIGIQKTDIESIFQPFYKAKNEINRTMHGMGLGLSITKRLVEILNGQIKIESEVDVGTTVIIKLPKMCEEKIYG